MPYGVLRFFFHFFRFDDFEFHSSLTWISLDLSSSLDPADTKSQFMSPSEIRTLKIDEKSKENGRKLCPFFCGGYTCRCRDL